MPHECVPHVDSDPELGSWDPSEGCIECIRFICAQFSIQCLTAPLTPSMHISYMIYATSKYPRLALIPSRTRGTLQRGCTALHIPHLSARDCIQCPAHAIIIAMLSMCTTGWVRPWAHGTLQRGSIQISPLETAHNVLLTYIILCHI